MLGPFDLNCPDGAKAIFLVEFHFYLLNEFLLSKFDNSSLIVRCAFL